EPVFREVADAGCGQHFVVDEEVTGHLGTRLGQNCVSSVRHDLRRPRVTGQFRADDIADGCGVDRRAWPQRVRGDPVGRQFGRQPYGNQTHGVLRDTVGEVACAEPFRIGTDRWGQGEDVRVRTASQVWDRGARQYE